MHNSSKIENKSAMRHVKKSLAQEVRQKSDISDRRSKGWRGRTLTLFATRPTVSLYNLSGVILHQKWIWPFLSEIWCQKFFYSTVFSKKSVFSEKTAKNCIGGAFHNFLGKEGVLTPKINITFLSQMRYRIFYYLPIFSKNV